MHHASLEKIQSSSTPLVDGELNVYFSFVGLLLGVAAPSRLTQLATAVVFVTLGLHAAGRDYLGFARLPVYFAVPSIGVILVFTSGETAFSVPLIFDFVLRFSDRGVERAVTTALRSGASLSVLVYFILTTTVPVTFSALKRLRLPDFFVEFCLLTYRGIQILTDESERLQTAARARLGYSDRRSLFRSTKLIGFSLFLKSLTRAERMEESMRSRSYSGEMPSPRRQSSGHVYATLILLLLSSTLVV
ncbi:MAG: cobalt ECF transporter T component CbiQ [Halobacteria archaeon]|nr:cobalt ECF transporter T component CbiQ [Halobacteria archaeon]